MSMQGWKGAFPVDARVIDKVAGYFEHTGHKTEWEIENGKGILWVGDPAKKDRPICGARTRAGGTCKARAVPGSKRCRIHGGLSTGPSEAGCLRIAQANRDRARRRREARESAASEPSEGGLRARV